MVRDKRKPAFVDQLTPELGGKVVALVHADMERAKREAEDKRAAEGATRRRRKQPSERG
jgi:hypothetical protein